MCPQCKEIFLVWNKESKSSEDLRLLAEKVPERFMEFNRYYVPGTQGTVCELRCNHCEQIFNILH